MDALDELVAELLELQGERRPREGVEVGAMYGVDGRLLRERYAYTEPCPCCKGQRLKPDHEQALVQPVVERIAASGFTPWGVRTQESIDGRYLSCAIVVNVPQEQAEALCAAWSDGVIRFAQLEEAVEMDMTGVIGLHDLLYEQDPGPTRDILERLAQLQEPA